MVAFYAQVMLEVLLTLMLVLMEHLGKQCTCARSYFSTQQGVYFVSDVKIFVVNYILARMLNSIFSVFRKTEAKGDSAAATSLAVKLHCSWLQR